MGQALACNRPALSKNDEDVYRSPIDKLHIEIARRAERTAGASHHQRRALDCSTSFVSAFGYRRQSHYAAEPDMAGRGIDRLGVPRGRAVSAAIVRRAEVRAALEDRERNLDVGEARVVACVLTAAAGIFGDAAGFCGVGGVF
jgi:hypothetical protein